MGKLANKLVRSGELASYNLADAKARLSELVDRAARGEDIQIAKPGEAKVRLVAVKKAKKPVDLASLQRITAGMELADLSSVELLRHMRDDRY